jgi:hypothetical protein
MSHVDEGLLHALLDGGLEGTAELAEVEDHLSTCGECRQRLDEVRALRERTAAILGAAPAGAVAMPPFAEVLARKRGSRTRPPALRIRRLTALGWAATVAIAAGVGWIARDSLSSRDLQPEARSRTVAAPPARVGAVEAPATGDTDDASAQTSEPVVLGDDELAVPRQEAAEVSAEALTAAEAPAPTAGTGGRGAEAAKGREPASPPPAEERMLVPAAVEIAPPKPALREQARSAARHDVNETDRVLAQPPAGGDWQSSDVATAAAHLGRALATVEGLAVLRIETGSVGGAPAVRVTQGLVADSLTITQFGAGEGVADVAVAGVADAPAGDAVQIERDGLIIILQGRVARDSLLRLAGRIP